MIANPHVLFCGENPQVILMDGEEVSAALSYWRCTYSPYGEGQALLLMMNKDNASQTQLPTHTIYTDNLLLARYVTDAFNRHFDDWQSPAWLTVTPVQARFVVEGDSRHYQRLACFSENLHLVAEWQDVATHELRVFRDMNKGTMGIHGYEHFDVSTVICLCESGRILVNDIPLNGKAIAFEKDGRLRSSVFLAYSEVWTRTQLAE